MEWLEEYHRKMEKIKKQERAHTEKKILSDLKKKHFFEKKLEIEALEKRLAVLKMEIKSYE
jgi:hypothetical protein